MNNIELKSETVVKIQSFKKGGMSYDTFYKKLTRFLNNELRLGHMTLSEAKANLEESIRIFKETVVVT